MTKFNEALVNRDTAGRFDTKMQSEPELTLGTGERTGADVVYERLSGRTCENLFPRGLTETRRAVKNLRGEPDGKIRTVTLTWDSVPPAHRGDPLEVAGPKDGRPLIIDVHSGCPDMAITSGNVVLMGGGSGYGITVKEGAHLELLASAHDKFSVTAESGSRVDFYAEEGVRGYQHIKDGAHFTLHGQSSRLTLSTDLRG